MLMYFPNLFLVLSGNSQLNWTMLRTMSKLVLQTFQIPKQQYKCRTIFTLILMGLFGEINFNFQDIIH